MPVKKNHQTLYKKLCCFFEHAGSATLFEARFQEAREVTRGRGREEIRTLRVSADMPQTYTGFPGVRQVLCLTRQVTYKKSGQVSQERVYAITNLEPAQAPPECLLGLLRGHWTIENKSHYVRDVSFGEDTCRVRSGGMGQVLAALRNACISLMRLAGETNIAAAKRRYAAKPIEALNLIGCTITE